jgi:choline dehydrogenase
MVMLQLRHLFSTAAMYLRPAMKEAGNRLTVSTDTLVHRVLFSGRRAVGIEYQTGGQGTPIKRVYASREVRNANQITLSK